MRNHNFHLTKLISWNMESMLKIRINELDHSTLGTNYVNELRNGFQEKFLQEKRKKMAMRFIVWDKLNHKP